MKNAVTFLGIAFCFIGCIYFSVAHAQQKSFFEYMQSAESKGKTIGEMKTYLDSYYATHPRVKGSGWSHYQRWLDNMLRHFGENNQPANYHARNFDAYNQARETASRTTAGPTVTNGFWFMKNGTATRPFFARVNCMAFHPTNSNIIFAGTPKGGLWKSSNAGVDWTLITPHIASAGISSIAIDAVDPNVIYIMTGDGESNFVPSLGVFKTTDGGINWFETGLNFTRTQFAVGRDIRISPLNRNYLLATFDNVIIQSLDGGSTWDTTLTSTRPFTDIEFKPFSNTCYAATGIDIFYKTGSTFAWNTSSQVAAFPLDGVRTELAVTPAAPNNVYAINANQSFTYLSVSTNSGAAFLSRCSSPNVTSYNAFGSTPGAQTSYNMGIAVSPTNANNVYVSAINLWKSTDGGFNFGTQAVAWYYGAGSKYIHEDHHYLEARSNTEIWAASDGGIYKTTDAGVNWSFVSSNLFVAEFYNFDYFPGDADYFHGGTQDDGGNRYDLGSVRTGDPCCDAAGSLIDYTNRNRVYANGSNAFIYRSGTGFSGTPHPFDKDITPFYGCNCQDTLGAFIVRAMAMHPTNPNTIYVMYKDFFVSNNNGDTWTRFPTGIGCCVHNSMAVAPGNPNIIYACINSNFRWSNNGGATWNNIPFPSGISAAVYTDIAVDPSNPMHVWLTNGAYDAGYKVFEYTNSSGGTAPSSWLMNNRSSGLPNVPVWCIEHDKTSADGLYIGTDIGVYYRNNSTSGWVYFGNGLPYAAVNDLRIDTANNLITAATFGMGLWQSFTYGNCAPFLTHNPGAFLAYNPAGDDILIAGDSIHSTYYFQGGAGFNMRYRAGAGIRLKPGFGVKAGTSLRAYIGPCNNGVGRQSEDSSSLRTANGELKKEEPEDK